MSNVVFLAHGIVAGQIRSRLFDLRSVGLLEDFLWIDYAHDPADEVVRTFSADSSPRIVGLDAALRPLDNGAILVLIDPLDPDSPVDAEALNNWVNSIDNSLVQGGTNQRLRIMLPSLPLRDVPAGQLNGWSNFALSPEDSDTPGSPLRAINREEGDFGLAEYAAPSLASVMGLWRDMDEAPIAQDGRVIETGDLSTFRLVRAYHRTIDATNVEEEVKQSVFDLNAALPRPQLNNNSYAVHHSNPDALTTFYADGFLNNHAAELVSRKAPLETLATQKVKGWEALRQNLALYWATVIGKPQDWVNAQKGAASSRAAGLIQRMLYGENSSIEVTVGEHSGRSRGVASIAQLRQQNRENRERAQQAGLSTGDDPQLAQTWHAYQEYSLALVDGISGLDNFALERDSQNNVFIVQRGWQAIADTGFTFNGEHPLLLKTAGQSDPRAFDVLPFDPRGAGQYEQELDFVYQQTRRREIAQKQNEFSNWRRNFSTTFGWKVGERLNRKLNDALEENGHLAQTARDIEAQRNQLAERDFNAENRRLTTALRWMWAILFVVLVLVSYFCAAHYRPGIRIWESMPTYDWRWLILGYVIAVGGFFLTSWFTFTKAQRELYDYVRNRELLERNEKIALDNLALSFGDVDRVTKAYEQFLSWSSLLGRAIAAPFGSQMVRAEQLRIPESGLPRNTSIGRAVVSPPDVGAMAREIRVAVFPRRWAHDALENLFVDVSSAVNRSKPGFPVGQLNDLYALPGRGSQSQLDQLVKCLDRPDVLARDLKPQRWRAALAVPSINQKVRSLLHTVQFREGSDLRTLPTEEFLARMSQDAKARQAFSNASLTAAGVNAGGTSIDGSHTRIVEVDNQAATNSQLSRSLTVVQYGNTVSLAYLQPDEGRAQDTGSAAAAEFSAPAGATVPTAPSAAEDSLSFLDSLDDIDHMESFDQVPPAPVSEPSGNPFLDGAPAVNPSDTSGSSDPAGFSRPADPADPEDLSDLDETF
ncbi:hypothetical protein [Corynebacterium flavescens]|uniref:Uncharacterized protein n=1 Tax=Corynebacterium flavescens TaxID=28028 RepID=A0A1L7CJ99_CORFL|nr:hypothetical protein [Corynebacterium flavescens]APT85932.1 hypothetical protein CFLV_01080 [Corynebacterium flavescens]KAA8724864.1 hypothetical protein F4V60_01015 [Corynebacterium flavescens]MDN6431459.1 hypothetical protein [Corynebacterium flavescens]MDN6475167.1 hypothetical protein [Corynebacterium flavescens]MDN6601224.1 hypothetical protein [Corynebacterium flavescens]